MNSLCGRQIPSYTIKQIDSFFAVSGVEKDDKYEMIGAYKSREEKDFSSLVTANEIFPYGKYSGPVTVIVPTDFLIIFDANIFSDGSVLFLK